MSCLLILRVNFGWSKHFRLKTSYGPHVFFSLVVEALQSWTTLNLICFNKFRTVSTCSDILSYNQQSARSEKGYSHISLQFKTSETVECCAKLHRSKRLSYKEACWISTSRPFDWLKPVNVSLVRILHISLTNVLTSQYWCGSIHLCLKITIKLGFANTTEVITTLSLLQSTLILHSWLLQGKNQIRCVDGPAF